MKKLKLLFVAITLIAFYNINAQGVSINEDGSAADGSAMLDVKSTDKGFLPPRLSTSELKAIPNPAEGLVVYNTTSKTLNVFNGTNWTDMAGNVVLAIGDYYQGGVVFYLNGSGGGLICAVSDQSSGAEWGCWGTEISGADGTAIGTGAQNTIDIEAGCAVGGTAADLCANLSNGYDDWFLPSKDELDQMHQQIDAINATALANGGAAFVSTFYWSSSEVSNDDAWVQVFDNNGIPIPLPKGSNTIRVRAVRAF